jgi:membrane protein DedA with SNARE-associated domain
MLPVIRTFISLPAGAARVPLARFSLLTAAGCVPWVLLLAVIGEPGGHDWRSWHGSLQYVDYFVVVAAAAMAIAILAVPRPWARTSGP